MRGEIKRVVVVGMVEGWCIIEERLRIIGLDWWLVVVLD